MYYPAGSVRLRGGTLWVAPPQRHQTGLPGASGWYCEGYSGLGLRGLMGDPGGGKRWAVKSGGHNRDIKRPQPGAAGAVGMGPVQSERQRIRGCAAAGGGQSKPRDWGGDGSAELGQGCSVGLGGAYGG